MGQNRENSDFMRDLVINHDASLPYEFRNKTGLVMELNLVAGRTMQLVHETLSVATVLQAGVGLLKTQPELVEMLRKSVAQTASGGDLLAQRLYPLYSIVIVNLCAAIEAGIEDTLVVAARFRPGLIKRLAQLGVTKLQYPEDRDLTYREAKDVLARLKAFARDESIVPNKWLLQLDAVGLPVSLAEVHRRGLRELIYVRNCIVHRAHRVDERCGEEMSTASLRLGDVIQPSREAMSVYASATIAMASAIADAARHHGQLAIKQP